MIAKIYLLLPTSLQLLAVHLTCFKRYLLGGSGLITIPSKNSSLVHDDSKESTFMQVKKDKTVFFLPAKSLPIHS